MKQSAISGGGNPYHIVYLLANARDSTGKETVENTEDDSQRREGEKSQIADSFQTGELCGNTVGEEEAEESVDEVYDEYF